MGSTMNTIQRYCQSGTSKAVLTLLATAGLCLLAPVTAQAGHVGWTVSVGGGHLGYGGGYGYGGGWRPAYYGPGPAWRVGYYGPGYVYPYGAAYYSQPVVTYSAPPQPMVLSSQTQPPVWYYCEASGQYFPYVQSCTSGWQAQPAIPPSSNAGSVR
jgi:hypothetical protein